MKFGKKVSNIIKKEFNSELLYHKKYLKSKKKITQEKISLCLCASNID